MPGVFGYVSAPSGWALQFFDDWPMNVTPCDATQRLPDIPSTLDAVATWLAEPGVRPSPVALNVDGRRASRFDLDWEGGCPPEIRPYVANGYGSGTIEPVLRIYAIETGDDIILAQLSADAGSRPAVLHHGPVHRDDRIRRSRADCGTTWHGPGRAFRRFAPLTQNVADPPGQHFLDFEGRHSSWIRWARASPGWAGRSRTNRSAKTRSPSRSPARSHVAWVGTRPT